MSPKKFRTKKRAAGNKAVCQRMKNIKKNKLKSISNSTVSTDIQQTDETIRSQPNIISVTEDSNDKLLDTFSGNENTISICNISLPLSQSEPISSSTPTNTSVYHQPLSEVDIISHRLSVETSENSSYKNNESNFLCGRRIVNISYVFEQAQVRHNGLTDCSFADMDFKSEVLKGFYSIFIFKYRVCGIENNIYSEKIKQECSMPINKAVVSGCFAIGIGQTQLSEFTAFLEVPSLSCSGFNKVQVEIGNIIYESSWDEMKQAGEVEKRIACIRFTLRVASS